MKKFKLFMAIAVVFTATFMTGCEKPKDDVKENTEQKQEENTVLYRSRRNACCCAWRLCLLCYVTKEF